ncbi:MAG: phage portal protein [Caulobacteraceae bacterium]|nr:phage portal protein [Caulobacteraceae bacterium]
MAKRTTKRDSVKSIEPDDRTIPGAWVSASLIPGEASTSYTNQNTGRDYDLVTRGITGTAWRAASINATVLSGQTLRLYRVAGTTGSKTGRKIADRRQVKHATNRGRTKSLIGKAAMYAGRAGEDIEEVLDHPVLDLLQNPDPIYTGPLWLWMLFWFKEIAGRAYIYVGERGTGNVPVSAYILPSEFAWPILSDTGLIGGYYYGRNRSSPMRIPSDDVVYLRQHGSPIHPAGGMSWLFSVLAETDMEAAALQAEAQRWLNGGMPGMVFKASPTTTDAQMKQINAHLNQSTRGVGKAGSVLLLRDTDLIQYGTKPHEMQYVEGITTTEKRIYDAAGIPEPIYRLNSANLASATVANAQYMRYTIAPRLATLAAELTELLLPQFGVEPGEMWFCFDDPAQEDQIQLATEMRAAEMQGLVRPNEYRAIMDLEALPEEMNLLRYRQTEAPSAGILGGLGLPAPSKASEMPSKDMGSVDVEAGTVDEDAAHEAASVDMESGMDPASPSVDVESADVSPSGESVKSVSVKADGYKPTDAMATEAQRGLDWRAEFGRGGTEVGVARARDIVNKRNLSLDTVYRMASYFARHEVDKQGTGWKPGEEGYPSAGRIAWALWGGDAGRGWADKIISDVEAEDNKMAAGTEASDGTSEKSATGMASAANPCVDHACGCRGGTARCDGGTCVGKGLADAAEAGQAKADAASGDVVPVEPAPGADTGIADQPQLRRVPKRCKAMVTMWDDATGVQQLAAGVFSRFERDLRAWYASVVPHMIGTTPDASGLPVLVNLTGDQVQALNDICTGFIIQTMVAGGIEGFARIGIDDATFNTANEDAMRYVRGRGLELATSIPDTLKATVNEAMANVMGTDRGVSVTTIRDAVLGEVPDLTGYQATRIARTEVSFAFNEGSRQAWKQAGVAMKEWDVAGGQCDICEEIQTKYSKAIPIDEAFTLGAFSGMSPPAHPNCRCGILPVVEYTDD